MTEDFLSNFLPTATPDKIGNSLDILILIGHSLVLGIVLAFVTYYTASYLLDGLFGDKLGKTRAQLIMGATNILFLCVGLTGVMILVNNNLARAFAIGAALALVRFRIKLGEKTAGSNLLFGIIAGIACGVNQLVVAWGLTFIYCILQVCLQWVLKKAHKGGRKDLEEIQDIDIEGAQFPYSQFDLTRVTEKQKSRAVQHKV